MTLPNLRASQHGSFLFIWLALYRFLSASQSLEKERILIMLTDANTGASIVAIGMNAIEVGTVAILRAAARNTVGCSISTRRMKIKGISSPAVQARSSYMTS